MAASKNTPAKNAMIDPRGDGMTMTSKEMAELTEKRHDNVKRTIETLANQGVIALPQIEEVPNEGPGPKTIGLYRIGKRDSYIIVAQLSPEFTARLVDRWQALEDQARQRPAKLPYHLERHMLNFHKIPNGCFSVLQEMTNVLVAPMEAQGYHMPENMMPDITHGKMFCKHLRDKHGIDTDQLPTYTHTFPDGREVEAKLYPVRFLGEFRVILSEIWMAQKAAAYFKDRDPNALAALDKILLIGVKKPAANYPALKPPEKAA